MKRFLNILFTLLMLLPLMALGLGLPLPVLAQPLEVSVADNYPGPGNNVFATGKEGGTLHLSPSLYVLDQSFTAPDNLICLINEAYRYIAQTFTAGMTGTLAGVNINVVPLDVYPLHVAIHSVTGGMPSTAILGETTLGSSSAPLSQFITFPGVINIVAGVQYAIVVDYPTAPPPGAMQAKGYWRGAIGDVYTGGDICYSNDGSSWSRHAGFDVHFQTYVFPGPPPPPPVEVGGTVYPVNKLAVLAPWIVLVAALLVGTAVVVRRRRAQSWRQP